MTGRSVEPILALLQVGDSLFPSGAFTHSYGLEQLSRDGSIRRPEQAEAFVRSVLHLSLATADGPACHAAAIAGMDCDLDAMLAADRAYLRSKAPAELRTASLAIGRRHLEEVLASGAVEQPGFLQQYCARMTADRTLGAQPVVFGAVCGAMGIDAATAVAALLFGAVNGLLQASMRLLPVSHRDVQAALVRLRADIAVIAGSAALAGNQIRSFHPVQEIASMRHADARARLFAS